MTNQIRQKSSKTDEIQRIKIKKKTAKKSNVNKND